MNKLRLPLLQVVIFSFVCSRKINIYIPINNILILDEFFMFNFSARLASGTGAGDNPGLKEEGKKDGISGKYISDGVE